MYKRLAQRKLEIALKDTPAIMIVGPRQCGKTTLAKKVIDDHWIYLTLDDLNQLQFAKSDPMGFIRQYANRHVVIDEIQRAPELILPIKQSIDENRIPGRFLLTGSANALALPRVADSLAGRLEVITLLPLAECEINNKPSTFLTKLLTKQLPETRKKRVKEQLISKIIRGGFPESITRKDDNRKLTWFNQYILRVVQKDLIDLGQIEHLDIMPKLIQVLSNHAGKLINYTEVANLLGISRQTVARYLQLLEQLFIFQELPAWHRKENKRLSKTPKAHIVDSGLLCALKRINQEKIYKDPTLMGSVLENYVLCELRRLATWHDEALTFYHFRDKEKTEVDIVIETMAGDVMGIEVKASATIRKQDFQGLERLKKIAGKDFHVGVILYDGDHSNIIDQNIFAIPIACLWE